MTRIQRDNLVAEPRYGDDAGPDSARRQSHKMFLRVPDAFAGLNIMATNSITNSYWVLQSWVV